MGKMFSEPLFTGGRNEILRAISSVRNRWRLRVAIRGISVLVVSALSAFLISSYGLELFKFDPVAIIVFRVLTYVSFIFLGWWLLIRPVFRRISDERVALYIEEHEPSLQTEVLSAVEEGKKEDFSDGSQRSPELVRRLIESAVVKVRDIDMGRSVEQPQLQRSSGFLVLASVVTVLIFLFGPAYFRHGLTALLTPMGNVEAASPYHIEVIPGNMKVAKGSDQTVTARLIGFESDEVNLFMDANSNTSFESLPLISVAAGTYEFEVLLFDLQESTNYFVESMGVESPTFSLEVIDLPYVERLQISYYFPDYTGLKPRVIEDGGDIAVLEDTEVRLLIIPTIDTVGGQLVLDKNKRIDLVLQDDGTLSSSFIVEEKGFYLIDLQDPDGELVTASPQYTIDVITDQPPSLMFVEPGRDTTANSIEEIFVEARADDDFGLRSLQLFYSVNGGLEETVNLFSGRDRTIKEVSAGHTFFLEELNLEPGDFVSYYASATDRNLAQENNDVKSDLYFIQIRSFSRDFRVAQSQGMIGGGSTGGADPRALSQAQKEIVAGTFNVVRDRDSYTNELYRENLVFLALAQGRLREQVETLIRRMNSRVMPAAPEFAAIARVLPLAADEMRQAEQELQGQDANGALSPEQQALKFLQRAEEAYEEVMVARGSGGGGRNPADDLADLFELELDKLQNQYETIQRGEQRQSDDTIDELMERLRELARRQERETDRQRRRARGQQSAPGGGDGQRALAEEVEEAARRLERLAREMNSPEVMDAFRRLQEAADAMRRAATNSNDLGFSEAGTALDRLREVQDQLQKEQTGRLERNIRDAIRRADRLVDDEKNIESDVIGLAGLDDRERQNRLQALMQRKDAMETEVEDLEQEIDSTSADFRREERDASRQLSDAANSIRNSKLKEKIRYSKGLVRSRDPETARTFEEVIIADIDDLRDKLQAAANAVGGSKGDALTQALDKTRDLMRGLESLEHRVEGQDQTQNVQQDVEGEQQQDKQSSVSSNIGGLSDSGDYGDQRPGVSAASPQDIRQWQREFKQRSADAQDIRRLLQQEDYSVGELDEIIKRMREFDNLRIYQDVDEFTRLQTFILEEFKRFEYRLRREVNSESEDLFLASSDDVPPGFRDLIEEYYRALSKNE
jgi:hypothetical protein